jgi:type I restriction enzyme M protein
MSAGNTSTLSVTTPQQLARIAGFIWGIADDVLRDLYVRGKYRDVILPMTVLRRFDAVLEPTKQAVLEICIRIADQCVDI